jgi:hypothetical protein
MHRFHIYCAANEARTLSLNLAASPDVVDGLVPLTVFWNRGSASSTYATAQAGADAEYLVFAHQDIFLPRGWFDRVRHAVRQLDALDGTWAVAGLAGVMHDSTFVGHVWDSGLGSVLGGAFATPLRAASLDELVLILRRSSGVTFDPDLPRFHLYGTDIVLDAEAKGRTAYVIDAPSIHNSRPIPSRRLGRDYVEAYRYVARKWHARLPWPTVIFRLITNPVPLAVHRLRNRYWRVKVGLRLDALFNELPNPAAKADELGFASIDFAAYKAAHPIVQYPVRRAASDCTSQAC